MTKSLKVDKIFFLILLFSLLFRITNLNFIEFKTDEAVNLVLAARPVLHQSLPPGGTVSSVGVLNPPLFNYLLTPLTFFTLDPKVFSFFIAFVNSLAISLFYLIVKKYYTRTIAFTSTVLFALSPWAIIYSRKIWEQDLLVPFFVILFYSAHKVLKEKKGIFWLPLTFVSIVLIQLHQIVILFIALSFLFLIFQRVKFNFKYILIGIILGIIPLLPYFGYETKNGFNDFKSIFSSQNRLGTNRSIDIFLRPLEITGQGYINFELGPDFIKLIDDFPFIKEVRYLFYFEYILIIFGAIVSIRKQRSLRFLTVPAVILPLIYYFLKIEPFMHYYIIILPILFLFLGSSFEFFFNQKNKLFKYTFVLIFLSLISASLYFNFSFFKLLSTQGHLQGDYGSSLNSSEKQLKYKKYDEAFLYRFIPLGYYFGYNPFAKMIFGEISSKSIPRLEEELTKKNDSNAQHELLAYYTKEPPSIKTIDVLRKKTQDIPKYAPIYNLALDDYMARNYKKQYLSDKLDITFFYPQHWKIMEKENIIIEGDFIKAILQKGSQASTYPSEVRGEIIILNQKAEKIECKKNGRICGNTYYFNPYSAVMNIKSYNKEGLKSEIGAFEDLLKSIRYISI